MLRKRASAKPDCCRWPTCLFSLREGRDWFISRELRRHVQEQRCWVLPSSTHEEQGSLFLAGSAEPGKKARAVGLTSRISTRASVYDRAPFCMWWSSPPHADSHIWKR